MADRMYAEIRVPTILIAGDVAEAVKAEFSLDDQELKAIFEENKDGIATFSEEEVAWGRFDLEDDLVELNVPFDRQSAAKYEYEAELRVYRPASECGRPEIDATVDTDNDGEPYVTCKELLEIADLPDQEIKNAIALKVSDKAPHFTSPLAQWATGALVPKIRATNAR